MTRQVAEANLTVVIPVYEDISVVGHTLSVLHSQVGAPLGSFRVIVVDDGSPQVITNRLIETAANFNSFADFHTDVLKVWPESSTFRAATARNLGMRGRHSARTLFLDGDTVPSLTCVSQHAAYGSEPAVVIGRVYRVTPAQARIFSAVNFGEPRVKSQLFDDRRLELQGWEYRKLARAVKRNLCFETDSYRAVWTCHCSVPTALTKELGGFWEDFQQHGGEDQELGWRLKRAGCKLIVDFRIEAFHLEHPLRGDPQSRQHWEMIARSMALPTLVRNGGPLP